MPSLNGHRATTVTGCLAGVPPWKDIHVHTRRRSKLVEEVFLLDAVGGIIYSCIPWNKKNGGQKAQSRQSLASEKQHQDTKGSRIGSKTN
jgi:hypothetical protein